MHIQLVAHVRGEQACWHATHSPTCMQDIKDRTLVHSTAARRTWENVGSDTECNATAGGLFYGLASPKVSDVAACKKSCEEDKGGCQSITFFDGGLCHHFGYGCTETKPTSKAISMRLIGAQPTTASSTSAGELILLCHRC